MVREHKFPEVLTEIMRIAIYSTRTVSRYVLIRKSVNSLETVQCLLVCKKTLCFQVETNGPKRWDDSLLTKEEAEAVVMSKKEASMRRERIKEYAVTHRVSILYTC